MRIAVAGTHCSGKSTLVHDFLAAHPEYVHEPEPYEWLEELQQFAEEPAATDFFRQLEMSVERLRGYGRGARMIAERSPLDFVAYILALEDREFAERAMALADEGMEHVDLLVVLPLDGDIEAPSDEDPELRAAMNEQLLELVAADNVTVVELHGSPARRLAALERHLTGGMRALPPPP